MIPNCFVAVPGISPGLPTGLFSLLPPPSCECWGDDVNVNVCV